MITTNIKQKTELGVHARDLLSRGEAVPDQMVARMLDIKMRSPEVAHHGEQSKTDKNTHDHSSSLLLIPLLLLLLAIFRLHSRWISTDG